MQSLCNDGDSAENVGESETRRNEKRWNRERRKEREREEEERMVVEEKREEGRGLEATDLLPGGLGQAHKVVLTRHGPPAGQDPREGKQQKKEKTRHTPWHEHGTNGERQKEKNEEKRKLGSVPV